MKIKLLLILLIAIQSISTFAQSTLYKPFEVDAGILIALPVNEDLNLGVGGYIEPKYNVHDNIALGFRMEFVALTSDVLAEIDGDMVDVSLSGVTSFLATGDYYFTTEMLRPFVGVGAGLFILGDVDYENDVVSTEHIGSRFGLAPRVGVVAGHFRIGVEYNIIPGLSEFKNRDYFSLKIGFEIGGGKISN